MYRKKTKNEAKEKVEITNLFFNNVKNKAIVI